MAKVSRQSKLWTRNKDGKVSLIVGDIFITNDELLNVMKNYCVQHGITLRKIKSTRCRYEQKCISNNCPFKIYKDVLVDKCTWMIRSLIESHKYPNAQFNKHALSRWVASRLLDDFKDNPIWIRGQHRKF